MNEVLEMKSLTAMFALSLCLLPRLAAAQPGSDAPEQDAGIPIATIIERLAEEIDREFVIDPRIRGIRAFTTSGDVDYESLLGLLRINGAVALETGEQIHIMPEENMRTSATRILQEDDLSVSDHEVVTRIIVVPDAVRTVSNDQGESSTQVLQATQLVPVLRPMMSRAAQLGAVPNTNALIVVDRYDNIRRITAVVEEIVSGLE